MSVQIPAFSTRVSAEAREAAAVAWSVRGSISMAPPAPAHAAAWRSQLNDAFRQPPELIARYENAVRSTELEGVRVVELAPQADIQEERALLYFHGGGYTLGEAEDGAVHGLARASKLRAFSVEYRKAPEHAFPAAQEDALAVYRALGRRYGAANLVVAGCSAGGGLAISMLLRARELGLAMPAALLAVSPWLDLTQDGDSVTHTSPSLEPLGSWEQAGLSEAARAYAGGRSLRDPQLSPLYASFGGDFPQTYLSTGTRDWFLSPCAELARTLRRVGVRVELAVWEGLGHAFEVLPIPEAFESHEQMARFAHAALKGGRR